MSRVGHNVLLDVRYPDVTSPNRRSSRFWVLARGALPSDRSPGVLSYFSDSWAFGSLDGADLASAVEPGCAVGAASGGASEWMFVELRPVWWRFAGIFTGTIHSRSGELAAYVTQESLLRPQT